jgi:hypothetical protein
MSTPSFTAQSLSTVSRRTLAVIAAAVAAVALAFVLLALNSGTTRPTTVKLVNATPVKTITPAGADTAQNLGTLNYGHSFAPAGNYTAQSASSVAAPTPFAGHR